MGMVLRPAKVRRLAPLMRTLSTRTIQAPQKRHEAFYNSPEFRSWRAQVVVRGRNRGAYNGDGERGRKANPAPRMYAHPLIELRDGGHPFDVWNGQCLC